MLSSCTVKHPTILLRQIGFGSWVGYMWSSSTIHRYPPSFTCRLGWFLMLRIWTVQIPLSSTYNSCSAPGLFWPFFKYSRHPPLTGWVWCLGRAHVVILYSQTSHHSSQRDWVWFLGRLHVVILNSSKIPAIIHLQVGLVPDVANLNSSKYAILHLHNLFSPRALLAILQIFPPPSTYRWGLVSGQGTCCYPVQLKIPPFFSDRLGLVPG
jgi:hypothetical protein